MEKAPDQGYQAYNIGRDDRRSMEEVAHLICRLTGRLDSLVQMVGLPARLVTPVKDASFDKAYRVLGYKAKVPLEEGIRRTIEWQREFVLKAGRPS
jgi:nucleoside-diphosphate-sugar epimerase